MTNVVHNDAKSFDGSYAEKIGIAWLGEHDFIDRLEILGTKNRVADVSLNNLRRGGRKRTLSDRLDSR